MPDGTAAVALPTRLAGESVHFQMSPDALWLFGFGLAPAALAGALATPSQQGRAGWLFGAAMSLIGALGVFGMRDGAGFLIAWEIMSFGGAVMILSEKLAPDSRAAGAVHARPAGDRRGGAGAGGAAARRLPAHSFAFAAFAAAAGTLPAPTLAAIGVLLLIGFGAKLGLLPFYEWFPNAYGAGSGASGALMSGVVLNAAFFGLSRGLLEWAPGGHDAVAAALGIFIVIVAVFSAILTALYAFQQEDWRRLLSFSSAENASIAVAMLGAALDLPRPRQARTRQPRLDRGAAASRRPCARQGRPVPDRRRRLSRDRPLRHLCRPTCCGAAPGCSASARCLRR